MKKMFTLAVILFAVCFNSNAQEYTTAIGIRGGVSSGLSVKHFILEDKAVEVIVDTRWRGLNVAGLYEIHQPLLEYEGLNWYYGGGLHVALLNSEQVDWGNQTGSYTVVGIDGIIGAEYTLEHYPITISIDYKPSMNVFGHTGLWVDNSAISIRYVFE